VVSTIELTWRGPGSLGSGAKPKGPNNVKLKEGSKRRTYPTVQVPPEVNFGKVTVKELVTEAPAANVEHPGTAVGPLTEAQPRSKFRPVESTKPTST
jgi:hypothetical protein